MEFAFLEMVSADALVRKNERTLELLKSVEKDKPLGAQLVGCNPDTMGEAAAMIEEMGFDLLDINCGCPVPKVVKKGGGCELMRQSGHLEKILRAVKKVLSVPLTLKIRSGWDSNNRNALEIAKMAEDCGVSMLAVHGRSRQDLYRGQADWQIISEVASQLKIPVVGSGDIIDGPSAVRALESGVSGLMVGRAALNNPWIFSELIAARLGRVYFGPEVSDVLNVIERYFELLLSYFVERAAVGRAKQFVSQVTRRIPASAEFRRELCTSSSIQTMREIIARFRQAREVRSCNWDQFDVSSGIFVS